MKISKNLRIFSERLFVGSWARGEGDALWDQSEDGAKRRSVQQPLRTSLHTLSLSLQNSLNWSRAEKLYHLMPARRYLFIPFLRTKSQQRQTKSRSSEKSHKTDRTNIIATNFVWEQLNKARKLSEDSRRWRTSSFKQKRKKRQRKIDRLFSSIKKCSNLVCSFS